MKNLTSIFLALFTCAAQAQITTYDNATQSSFFGIGGYSFTQTSFPDGVQTNPYVVSGPSPQNDFSYSISAVGGITNRSAAISTNTINTPITIQFRGNNIRKFACQAIARLAGGGSATNNNILLTATTNLGNSVSRTGNSTNAFVGFSVTQNQDEYIVSISATFPTTPNPASFLTLTEIIVGDNTPQNVALNLDGVNDYVEIPSTVGNFTTLQNFTVTCWIKADPTQTSGTTENDIVSKWNGLSGAGNGFPFIIRYLNSTNVTVANRGKILVGKSDGTTFSTITSTTSVNDGRWHHVAFVSESGGVKLYINGNLEGSLTNISLNETTNTTPLQIGRRGNGQNYFKGEIDEVRIWNIGKNATDIAIERFCKTPNPSNLQAAYNFNNGVPNGTNTLIIQIPDAVGTNNGTLNNFTKTGDASNFVMGQVKYVKGNATGSNNGSSWQNAFNNLQSALPANTCNDLVEVYVATGTYKPAASDIYISYNIPSGMQIYGGFAGTEKSINQRNLALIHSTNKTTLSSDLGGNDTPFNFNTNRDENSRTTVLINASNVVFDGFTVSGQTNNLRTSGASIRIAGTNATIKNSRVTDNSLGIWIQGGNPTIEYCSILGNLNGGITIDNSSAIIKESLIANNGTNGILFYVDEGNQQTTITNSTITANAGIGILSSLFDGSLTTTLKNCIIYDNSEGIFNDALSANNTFTYSLVQGFTSTDNGNLNGYTVDPQFVSPLPNGFGSLTANPNNLGDYRLKWCSLAIGAGTNTGIIPLDLDRNPRNFGGTADMGAYEFLGNTPSPTNATSSNITGTIDSPTYAGGAIQTLSSDAKILAPAGAIDFKAPNAITLNPGFEARGMSSYFKAQIGANSVCSN